MIKISATLKGVGFLVLALVISSLQPVAVKWIGGNYPILEMLLLRTLVALPLTLLFYRYEGRRGLPATRHLKAEILRGLFLFLSYTTYMMGVMALPLAEVETIRFSGPIIITLSSMFLLGEKVEVQRWLALLVGFTGVLLVVRPGSTTFNPGSIFILTSVVFYALTVMSTRTLQSTDSSATMAFYSSLVYLVATFLLVPFTLIVGEIPGAHPSVAFLFRTWSLPSFVDGLVMGGLGLVWAGWIYFMTKAYSLAQASRIAPFEYLSLPINVVWGFALWHEVPTFLTVIGAVLAISSGLLIFYLDQKPGRAISSTRSS